jgi:hypothetical protein
MAPPTRKPFQMVVVAVVVIVGVAVLVELVGGTRVFGRFQGLAIAVAVLAWFASMALEEEEPGERRATRIGLGCATLLLVGSIVELAL